MTTLEEIRRPVARELEQYEAYLRAELRGASRLSAEMLRHVLSTRGKGVRPLLVLLSAGVWGDASKGYLPAMLAEMLHTATLVHDDVIDSSPLRRGKPSVDALFGSRRAVLLGDLILARSFGVGMESGEYRIVDYITRCMTALCEGELLQSEMCDRHDMTLQIYEEIIYKKTATLIGTCCGAGAMAAGASDDDVARFKEMGDAAGMAFQIRDDILDFAADTGKPRCNDLREGKITLPLLAAMEGGGGSTVMSGGEASTACPASVAELLAAGDVDALCKIVVEGGGLDAATAHLNAYIDRAVALLHASCPPSPFRTSLEALFRFIASREK